MSSGAYAADKALAHPDRLAAMRAGRVPYPVHLHLILSDLCNLDCPGCAYRMEGYSSNELFKGEHGERNPRRFLSSDVALRVLDDCKAMGTLAVEFTGGGEPLMHPDAGLLLGHAQSRGLHTALITNGILLDKVLDEAARCQWVRVSLDAATPEVYGRVRPTPGNGPNQFWRALSNLEALCRRRRSSGSDCTIGAGFVVQRENWQQMYCAAELYRSRGVDNMRISGLFTPEGDRYFDGWRREAEDLEQLTVADFDEPGRFRVHGRLAEKISDLQHRPRSGHCWYQYFTLYLGADANVYRCCTQSYSKHGLLGSLHNYGGSLKRLLDDPAMQKKIAEFDAASCKNCQFHDRIAAIDTVIGSNEALSVPTGIIHPYFV